MGYFSNGTEGADYEATWCERCVHNGNGEGPYCPVWALHHEWNTDQCRHGWPQTTDPAVRADSKAKDAALAHFIPRIGIENGACRMFVASVPEWRGREDELRKTWDDAARERKRKYEERTAAATRASDGRASS